jgi:uncharacterized zinc-type alcohol dehydrogenase-like protein
MQPPIPIESAGGYTLSIIRGEPTEALGYGNLRRDLPLQLMSLDRRPIGAYDIAIDIIYCGVCHSDWHVIKDEWRNTKYPIITGHEIIGIVLEVGSQVNAHKKGDLVGTGPNTDSCGECHQCTTSFEQYCENDVTEVYNMPQRIVMNLNQSVQSVKVDTAITS